MGRSKEMYTDLQEQEANLPDIFKRKAPSKSEIQIAADRIIQAVNDGGDQDPLRVAAMAKAMEETIKLIRKGITEVMIEEAEKYGKEPIKLDGHSFVIREAGAKYDYSECGDPEWNEINDQIKELNEKRKDREKFLKAIKDKATLVDDDSGEITTIYPPSKTSTTTVAITLAK